MKHKYKFLTPYMRRVLKKKLDNGEISLDGKKHEDCGVRVSGPQTPHV